MPSIFVFDAYGTLFDVHAAIAHFRAEAGPEADRLSDIWTRTDRVLDYALPRLPSVPAALKPKLLECYFKLDAFPDARAALRALKGKGHKTGILSNGSPAM